ncbi:hypothetical protein [Methylibium sp.]|jgi:uncharacterized membrane protein YczE|uniref:hypothetical protein n=1 Tax=Methylibium sp. TaxID=2067992 RepID=UPI003D0ED6C3
MKIVLRAFSMIHAVMALLFALASLLLMAIAARTGWAAVAGGIDQGAALGLIEATGLMAVAVVALQIAQTITEEEVVREAHVSGPTRVRRFLSRFLVVVVVALAIEGLIGVFKALRENPEHLSGAALLLVAVGVLLAGWGVFIRLNTAAEALEPEAMEQAKREDRKLD